MSYCYMKVIFTFDVDEVEMKNVQKNKEPEKVINISYAEYIKPYTNVNKENIYLDNAFIQQVWYLCLKSFLPIDLWDIDLLFHGLVIFCNSLCERNPIEKRIE